MKILYDSHVLISAFLKEKALDKTGVFRFAREMALYLSKDERCRVHLFSSLDETNRLKWQSFLEKKQEFSLFPLLNLYPPLKPVLDALSLKVEKAPFWKKPWLKGTRECLRLFSMPPEKLRYKTKGFDLFYSPYHPSPKWMADKSSLVTIHTIHDLIPLKYPKFFQVDKKSFFDRMLKHAGPNQYYFALSESTKADICYYYGIHPDRIFIVHSAPEPHLFYPVEDPSLLKRVQTKYHIQKPYLLSLATLEPRKNIPFLVDSFIELIESHPHLEIQLVLAGAKGWGFEGLLRKLEKYKEHILVTGYLPSEDLAPLYSGAYAFIYPSLYEGFGLPPLEAMSCAVPVIVSQRSSLPEVVGSAGLYIDPTSKDDICDRILKLIQNEPLRDTLSQKSLRRAKEFSWEKNAQTAHKAFKKILS